MDATNQKEVVGINGRLMTVCDDCSLFFKDKDMTRRDHMRMWLMRVFVFTVAIVGVPLYFNNLLLMR